MISIIIPVYNRAKKLDKCLESVAAQEYANYEIIVVNDRSTDRLSWVYKKYKGLFGYKFEWINNQANHGAPYSRNKGFSVSRGEFVIFCDADVVMKPEMLAVMHDTLKKNPEAAYAYSSFKFGRKIFRLWPFDADKLKTMPYIHSTSLIRRECFSGWDESVKRLQDWDLWLSMLEKGHSGVWIDKILFSVIDTGGTMSAWLPSFAYKIFPFLPRVRKYKQAVKAVKDKHAITR
jgi:glycosyltransferase involved in cell wall biosynthesis